MASLTDILTTVQNGVTAMSAFTKQLQGSVNNISSQLTSLQSSGVKSIDAKTGAFTTGNGIDTSVNVIELTAARRTLPTTQSLTSGSSATYTRPANCLWIEVFMVGGGGGGAGGLQTGSGTIVAGSVGTKSTFNGIDAAPGAGGGVSGAANSINNVIGGAGGTGGTGTATRRFPGFSGGNAATSQASFGFPSGAGGGTVYGGGGPPGLGSSTNANGNSAVANSGAGGGGASVDGGSVFINPPGGGGGESVYFLITSPAATYTYTIGSGGAGGVGGSATGGAGGSGNILVIEHYGS